MQIYHEMDRENKSLVVELSALISLVKVRVS